MPRGTQNTGCCYHHNYDPRYRPGKCVYLYREITWMHVSEAVAGGLHAHAYALGWVAVGASVYCCK